MSDFVRLSILHFVLARVLFYILTLILLVGCSVPVAAQEKVYPKRGDGISTLLKRHNREGIEYQRQFIELNKKRLGKRNTLLTGVAYTLPPLKNERSTKPKNNSTSKTTGKTTKKSKPDTAKPGYEPLFGSALAKYDIVSSELKGATFYVVSGHGGPDPGAIARFENHSLHEDEYAYDIALRLARNLMMRGAKVHIVIQDAVDGIRDGRLLSNSKRETCMGSRIPLNQTERLKQRADKINALYDASPKGYSRAIFLHIDSRSKHKKIDVFFYHSATAASKKLAKTMRDTFKEKYNRFQPNRGFDGTISERNLYVIRNTKPVGLYVELANIQNQSDLKRIIRKDNREALANWMCEGFIKDYNQWKKNN